MANNPKQFTTYIEGIFLNIHLAKEIAKIPYFMRILGYESQLVTFNGQLDYELKKKEVPELDIRFLKNSSQLKGYFDITGYKFILGNAKKIDILNLYHLRLKTIINSILYKILNPRGILFLKLDIDNRYLSKIEQGEYLFNAKILFISFFFRIFTDLVSVESTAVLMELKKILNKRIHNKFIFLPSGIDSSKIPNIIKEKIKWESKENIILSVGRLGTYQKNTEMLLNSLAGIDLKDWKVVLIGPIDNSFPIKTFENKYNFDKIIFKGSIEDRTEVFNYFTKAKVFCLTSRFESLGLVLVEALYFGNYIITTNVDSAIDITNNQEVGEIIVDNDIDSLASTLNKIIEGNIDLEKNFYKSLNLFNKKNYNYEWYEIVKILNNRIIDISNKRNGIVQ